MEDRKISEKESIEVITSMIARTKQRYIGNGNILLMWGYLVSVVSILVWVMLAATHQHVWNWLWFAIPLIGCIATPVMARKQRKECGVTTYSDKVTSRMWTLVSVAEIVLTVGCLGLQIIAGKYCWSAILACTLIIVPFAEIAQGLIIKEKSLMSGGMIGLVIGLVTLCCLAGNIALDAGWYMPLFILSFVAMMIVPGHIINIKAKRV